MRRAYYSKRPARASRGSGRNQVGQVLKYFPSNLAWLPSIYYNKMRAVFPVQVLRTGLTKDSITDLFTLNTNNMFSLITTNAGIHEVQPQGFDNMNNLWNRWQVMDCRVSVKLFQNSGVDGGAEPSPVTIACTWLNNGATVASSVQQMMAERYSTSATVQPYGAGQRPAYINTYAKTSSQLGFPISQNTGTFGTGNTPPGTGTFLVFNGFMNDTNDQSLGVTMFITMTMIVKWSFPVNFASSSGEKGTISVVNL